MSDPSVTVTRLGEPNVWGYGPHRIECSQCGPVATYEGEQFTQVEARRHSRWHSERS